MQVSGLVLAGGASRRMGRDKAWLEWEGRTLLARAVGLLRESGIERVSISGRAEADYRALGCPVLTDREPGQGPLGGIARGLEACGSPLVLVLAVDLPRMVPEVLRGLLSQVEGEVGVAPVRRGEWEPLVAVYPAACGVWAAERLGRGERSAREFAEACWRRGALRGWEVPAPLEAAFENWNQPEDLPGGGLV